MTLTARDGRKCLLAHAHHNHDHCAHGHKAKEVEEAKGPHHGRLLTDGNFTLELAIFKASVPPKFRAWFTKAGKPVGPADVNLSVTLIHPGKVKDCFTCASEGDFAHGDHKVVEPHSFDYVIVAVPMLSQRLLRTFVHFVLVRLSLYGCLVGGEKVEVNSNMLLFSPTNLMLSFHNIIYPTLYSTYRRERNQHIWPAPRKTARSPKARGVYKSGIPSNQARRSMS